MNHSSAEIHEYGSSRDPLPTMLREIWAYRELAYFLAWRDIKIRYKQTVLGILWALIKPGISILIFTVVFHRFVGVSTTTIPYPLLVLSGVLAWTMISDSITGASQSLLGNSNLVTKVYFPRIIIPMSAVFRTLADFVVALVLYFGLSLVYGVMPDWHILLLPIGVIYALFVALGISLWTSALSVQYRDIAHALPFIVQALFWISPVGYPAGIVPSQLALPYATNPITGVIEAFRFALFGAATMTLQSLLLSISVAAMVLVSGFIVFFRMESDFADMI